MRPALAALLAAAAAAVLAWPAGAAPRTLVRVGTFDSPVYLTAPAFERGVLYVVEQPWPWS